MQLPNEILIPEVARLVSEGKSVTLPLRGYSMRPYLEDGRDKGLLVKPDKPLKVGDVILAEIAPHRYALHRIVKIEGDDIVMYGDGNFSPEHIKRSDVLAIAIGFYRKGSTRLDSVNAPLYKLYWRTWVALRSLRRYLLILWRLWHYPKETVQRIIRKIST
ncbi:MAG: S24/S26 family peptidase [Prevotella sp.]|nr:S24/S26 family peptidase [Prevotella sp.]MBQ9237344.1 S24/S26 family peptidase [Prevotella sp.]MBR1839538.1 S24/S26 family peptidase [Prevotella sp.]